MNITLISFLFERTLQSRLPFRKLSLFFCFKDENIQQKQNKKCLHGVIERTKNLWSRDLVSEYGVTSSAVKP
jgi:hypothetical protein